VVLGGFADLSSSREVTVIAPQARRAPNRQPQAAAEHIVLSQEGWQNG
jgi:hypothetical protein